MLSDDIERLAQQKSAEREELNRISNGYMRNNPVYASWLDEWNNALTRTENAIEEWKESVGVTGSDKVAEKVFKPFMRAAEEQSQAFREQMTRFRQEMLDATIQPGTVGAQTDPGNAQINEDARPTSEQGNILPNLTGEGSWSDLLLTEARNAVPIGGHTLPPLPYAYNALEPHIDEQTMRIHHDKHHLSYVEGLNKAEVRMAEARKRGDYDLIKHWEREAAFNGGGHYLHTVFWEIMSPQGGGSPSGLLLQQIKRDFGGYEPFKKHFTNAANKVEGGGWALLVWCPRPHRLEILQSEKHQNLSQWDVIPLLVLDVWEHAYYLKHQSNRAAYIEAWWNVVNWPAVARRYDAANRLRWTPAH